MSLPEPAAIEFSHVTIAFDDLVVLRDLSFRVPKGDMRILLGRSGSGKSVLLKLILGLLKPDAGEVRVNGQRVDSMSEHDLLALRAGIGMVFQENALFDSLTVAENIAYPLSEEGVAREKIEARVGEVLALLGLSEFSDRLPSQLSGGQRRRVAIGRALSPAPGILLFDDPITGLDPLIATSIDSEIIKVRDLAQVTSMVVTHQIRDAFYIATHEAERRGDAIRIVQTDAETAAKIRFMVLHEGRIYFEGTAAELLASPDSYLRTYLLKTLPPW